MKRRSTALRFIVLLVSFGLVGGYVAYRVWAGSDTPQPSDPPIQFSGSKSSPIIRPGPETQSQPESHFVGSKSARVFEPPPQPTPPGPQKSDSEELGPVGSKP